MKGSAGSMARERLNRGIIVELPTRIGISAYSAVNELLLQPAAFALCFLQRERRRD